MAQPVIQASFNSGEWAPHLYARVDIQKYHSGAALLRNFFVDYRGGVSTRSGTKYVLKAFKSNTAVRLIPFQASLAVRYMMEFGDGYVRFHQGGAPVLEAGIAITGATNANPCVISITNTWSVGDWVFISGVGGTTQLNGKYYIVHARTGGTVTLYDLFGNPVDATAYGVYTAGGTAARVFTLASPYAAANLATLKFTQNVNSMIFCHPSYVPYQLTFASATSWALAPITFGTTILAPAGVGVATTLAGGTVNYAYIVTSVDSTGQESASSTPATLASKQDIRTTPGTNTISWTAANGAQSYNVYRSDVSITNPVPAGVPFGFIGNCTQTNFIDSNIAPDFATTPPIVRAPFIDGGPVNAVTVTAGGSYTTAPTITFSAPGGSGVTATGTLSFQAIGFAITAAGTGYNVGDTITLANGFIITVAVVGGGGDITTANLTSVGNIVTSIPAQPETQVLTSGAGIGASFTVSHKVVGVTITNPGTGYSVAPTVAFSAGAAAAVATLGIQGVGNPKVPCFFQQRLVMGGTVSNPQILLMSQPGQYYNYNVSNPIQADDAITANIVSGQLNNIKALVPTPGGLITLTDGASFLVNGGSLGAAVTPSSTTANAQSFLGCNDIPPIVSNYDILYVQSKGSSVRDASYNFYANVFTGNDISIIASHLFFGFQLLEWAWAEEPYKVVWAVRNDGQLLSLTFLKEQDFTGWAHHDSPAAGGLFKSIATIVEPATVGYQNFIYTVVQRTVQAQTVQYIEYFPERIYTNGVQDAVTVDCCYQYSGAPATNFTGATALAGLAVTGLADGVIIPAFTMGTNGSFTLTSAASKVTIGLAFTPQLQTLPLDTGEPTIQSKMKKLPAETVRVTETLGLQIGTDFSNLTDMKDLIRGNIGSMTNLPVTDLVTGDARTFLDPKWQEQGQICIQQSYPYPATILGVIPQLTVGDTPK